MQEISLLLDRLQDGLSLLEGEEREMGSESLALARNYFQTSAPETIDDHGNHQEQNGNTSSEALEQREQLVRLGQLAELLGRRRTQAMPYAALTRALIAAIHRDQHMVDSFLKEAGIKLSLFGL